VENAPHEKGTTVEPTAEWTGKEMAKRLPEDAVNQDPYGGDDGSLEREVADFLLHTRCVKQLTKLILPGDGARASPLWPFFGSDRIKKTRPDGYMKDDASEQRDPPEVWVAMHPQYDRTGKSNDAGQQKGEVANKMDADYLEEMHGGLNESLRL
jgi:hypothetical protein